MVEAERAALADESEQRLEAEDCCGELVKALDGALALICNELQLSSTLLLVSSCFGRIIQMQEARPQVTEALAWSGLDPAHNSDAPCLVLQEKRGTPPCSHFPCFLLVHLAACRPQRSDTGEIDVTNIREQVFDFDQKLKESRSQTASARSAEGLTT